ncbi:MAG: extracellular solute-binding protein [Velocimicrobium sp.]
MKRFLAMLTALVIVATTITGCSSKKEDTQTATTTQPEETANSEETVETTSASGDVEIWYYWENEDHQKSLNGIIDAYNASQSEIKVSAEYIPFSDFKKQLSIGASADELPDLVIIDSPDNASYATMGIFADLTNKFDVSDYFEGTVQSATLDGKLYGVPFGVNCLALYYNEDMLKEAGAEVPETWDQLKETAVKLTKGEVSGFAFSSVQNEEGTFNFMPWIWSTGASSFEINSEGGIKALSFVKDLVDSGAMSKECINWTQGDVMNQFMSGNVAMMVNGPWQIPTMRAEATDVNWNVALIPMDAQYASVLGGENYAVIAGGNEDAAISFLQYVTQEDNVIKLMSEFGYISAIQSIADTQFSDDPIYTKFTEELQYAKPRGPHANWPEISDAISLAFNEVITGTASAADAGKEAQDKIDAIINQ